MSATTPVGEDVDIVLGDEVPHVTCCVVDRFLCGRQFHPEAQALRDDPAEDCCADCVDIANQSLCPRPPFRPTHTHCPVPGPLLGNVCPWIIGRQHA